MSMGPSASTCGTCTNPSGRLPAAWHSVRSSRCATGRPLYGHLRRQLREAVMRPSMISATQCWVWPTYSAAQDERHGLREPAGVGEDVHETEDSTHGAGDRASALPTTHDVTSCSAGGVGRGDVVLSGRRRPPCRYNSPWYTTESVIRPTPSQRCPLLHQARAATAETRSSWTRRSCSDLVPAQRKSTAPQKAKTTAGTATAKTTLHAALGPALYPQVANAATIPTSISTRRTRSRRWRPVTARRPARAGRSSTAPD